MSDDNGMNAYAQTQLMKILIQELCIHPLLMRVDSDVRESGFQKLIDEGIARNRMEAQQMIVAEIKNGVKR